MPPDVRRVREEELPAVIDSLSTAFLERPDVDKVAAELKTLWDLDRTWAAFDGDRVAGTYRSWATEVTVPGGARLPGAAVTAVTVLPTHRRRGLLRTMVTAAHGAMRECGEAVGLLYASEYPIYGRFGYGVGTEAATWTLDTLATSFRGDGPGRIEIVKPGPDTRDEIKAVFEQHRSRQAGEIRRRDYSWDLDLGLRPSVWGPDWKGFVALHRDPAGAVDGYVRYRAQEKWVERQPRNVVEVDDLHALTDGAYLGLWRYLAEIDWVATVKAERRALDERFRWLLTNARAATISDLGDAMWVRLFDIPRALEARTYEHSASIVLEVIDSEASGGRLLVHLETDPDGASCRSTDRSPDLTLDVGALGAAYLGGTRLRDAVLAPGGVDEHRNGALAEADELLATSERPWCSTFF